ncbi:MAG: hypothetical protein Q4E67_04240, partial [Planctomycetia bacterium]|nr:hypothetical protein [Planctomycetia bacterium]
VPQHSTHYARHPFIPLLWRGTALAGGWFRSGEVFSSAATLHPLRPPPVHSPPLKGYGVSRGVVRKWRGGCQCRNTPPAAQAPLWK